MRQKSRVVRRVSPANLAGLLESTTRPRARHDFQLERTVGQRRRDLAPERPPDRHGVSENGEFRAARRSVATEQIADAERLFRSAFGGAPRGTAFIQTCFDFWTSPDPDLPALTAILPNSFAVISRVLFAVLQSDPAYSRCPAPDAQNRHRAGAPGKRPLTYDGPRNAASRRQREGTREWPSTKVHSPRGI